MNLIYSWALFLFLATICWISSVQSLTCVRLCNPVDCSMPGLPVHHQFPDFTQTHVHWVGDAIQLSHLLSPSSPLALNLSQCQGLFQWVSSSHQVTKYWSFSISPSKEYSGLISFRIDWFDLLAVQGTHKSLLQHHNSKASILWHSAFFMVQFSQLCLLENHSFDFMKVCCQSDVSAFLMHCLGLP